MKNKIVFFGNIFVDNFENYLRMKDSFNSIYDNKIFFDYIINIRGKYATKSIGYFKKKGVKNLFNISSEHGWYHDSYSILNKIEFSYIFCWLEDFINIKKNKIKKLFDEVCEKKIDIINYTSPYMISPSRDKFYQTNLFKYKKIYKKNYYKIFKNKFIISYGSIIKKELFYKIILKNDYGNWSKFTPFGFEKSSKKLEWLPLNIGYLNEEIFASIDDDHDTPKSSLQSRGLYPIRVKKRVSSNHLWEYLKTGRRFKLSQLFNNICKSLLLFFYLCTYKIDFNVFKIIFKKLNIINIDLIAFLIHIFYENPKNITLITLNNRLSEILIFFKLNLTIISDKIFCNEDNIILDPINYSKPKKKTNKNLIHNGYFIKKVNHLELDKKEMLIIHYKIFNLINNDFNNKKFKRIQDFYISYK
jgi:hypothetical protein